MLIRTDADQGREAMTPTDWGHKGLACNCFISVKVNMTRQNEIVALNLQMAGNPDFFIRHLRVGNRNLADGELCKV